MHPSTSNFSRPRLDFSVSSESDKASQQKIKYEIINALKKIGVNESLIKRLGTILRTMSSGYVINVEAFRAYSMVTEELYVELYEWYYMSSSVHKILINGADIN